VILSSRPGRVGSKAQHLPVRAARSDHRRRWVCAGRRFPVRLLHPGRRRHSGRHAYR